MSALRIVLDTNVLISGMAYPNSLPGKILSAWRNGALEIFLSAYILDELRRVLPRLHHRHGLSTSEIDDLTDILAIQTEIIEPAAIELAALRDEADLPILGTLLAGLEHHAVDYLITGDKDLLILSDRYPILSPADFWTRHGDAP